MPNAQTHLASVCDLLDRQETRSAFPWLLRDETASAFLMGAISPDARIFSGQSREATHFFNIPAAAPRPDTLPQATMLAAWPELADPACLDRARAAFVAGYITHLLMDLVWVEQVVMHGLFMPGLAWGPDHPNWWQYCLLMTYLEYQAAGRLPAQVGHLLAQAVPCNWLPFIGDQHLVAWRDHVAGRIMDGSTLAISRMFARSNNMTPEELEAIVLSEDRMADEAFSLVPRRQVQAFEAETALRSAQAVADYLHGLGFGEPPASRASPGEAV
jgi:hypothetical protein